MGEKKKERERVITITSSVANKTKIIVATLSYPMQLQLGRHEEHGP